MVSFTEYMKNKSLNEEETFDDLISELGKDFKKDPKSREMAARIIKAASKDPVAKDAIELIQRKSAEGSLKDTDLKTPVSKNLAVAIQVLATGAKDKDKEILKSIGVVPAEGEKSLSKSAVIKTIKTSTKKHISSIKSTEPVKDEPVKDEPVKDEPVKDEPVKDEPVKDEPVKDEPVKDETPDEKPSGMTGEKAKKHIEKKDAKARGEESPDETDAKSPAYYSKQASNLKDEKIQELNDKLKDYPEERQKAMRKVITDMESKLNSKIAEIEKQQQGYSYKSNFSTKLKATAKSRKLYNEAKSILNIQSNKLLSKGMDTAITRAGKSIAGAASGIKQGVKKVADSRTIQVAKDRLKVASGKAVDLAKRGAEVAAPIIKRTTDKVIDKIQTSSHDKFIEKHLGIKKRDEFIYAKDEVTKKDILDLAKKTRDEKKIEADKVRRSAKGKVKEQPAADKPTPPGSVMKAKTAAEKVKEKADKRSNLQQVV